MVLVQPEGVNMGDFAEKNNASLGVVSAVVFLISYGLCAFFGWRDVVNTLFNPVNLGQPMKMPTTYTVVSFVFLAVICAIVILGFIFKNKIMVFLAFFYQILFLLSFVMLGVFATGNVTVEGLYSFLTYLLTFTLLPVYGVIWNINFYFFILFIPLMVFNIIAIVKICRKKSAKK